MERDFDIGRIYPESIQEEFKEVVGAFLSFSKLYENSRLYKIERATILELNGLVEKKSPEGQMITKLLDSEDSISQDLDDYLDQLTYSHTSPMDLEVLIHEQITKARLAGAKEIQEKFKKLLNV